MAWEDELEPDWIYELPFYLAATIAYGIVLTVNPTLRWGSVKAADPSVPIEFVAALPAPPPGSALEARPKPAAVKLNRAAPPAIMAPPKPKKAKAKPAAAKTARTAPKPASMKAIIAASVARRAKVERAKAAKAAAVAAEHRAEEAQAAADARAQAARRKAEAAREKAAAAKAEKARRAALARAAAQRRADAARARREALAAAKAAKARKKAELSQELATMTDPDEALAQDAGSPPPAGASKAGAAAALADAAESADPGDAAGSGGADLLDAKAKGGGAGPDGAGVSYSLDGPVGSRRVLKRAVPSSPDWVGARGLDLTVTVRFQVLPDGAVKPGAVIQETSGFPEIDHRALEALRRWRFEAAAAGGAPEVWGRVTFRFTS